jgi:hypothetical protein
MKVGFHRGVLLRFVIPAQAGIQVCFSARISLDTRFRGYDVTRSLFLLRIILARIFKGATKDTKDSEIITVQFLTFVLPSTWLRACFATFVVKYQVRFWLRLCRAKCSGSLRCRIRMPILIRRGTLPSRMDKPFIQR